MESPAGAYLSVRQAATHISVSQRTIRRYIEQDILPAYRISGSNTIRIKRTDLESLLHPINAATNPDEPTAL